MASFKLVSPEIKVTIIDEPVHFTFEEIEGKFILVTGVTLVDEEETEILMMNGVEIRQVLRKDVFL